MRPLTTHSNGRQGSALPAANQLYPVCARNKCVVLITDGRTGMSPMMPEALLPSACLYYPDFICRIAGYAALLSGGMGGEGREVPPCPDETNEP